MKIKFLGTSASYSFPLPFCNCKSCIEARKRGGKDLRKRSSLLINDDLIIDLGQDLMSAAYMHQVDTMKIRYWLQTHSHSDHFSSSHLLTRLPYYATIDSPPLSLFASKTCMQNMSVHMDKEHQGANLLDPAWASRLNLDVNCVSPEEPFICGAYTVTALHSGHMAGEDAYYYLVNDGSDTLFYGIDADKHTLRGETLDYFTAKGIHLDILVLDHTRGYNIEADDHLNANEIIELIAEMKRRSIIDEHTKVLASHISHEGNLPHDEFAAFANQNGYDVAFDGLVVDISV